MADNISGYFKVLLEINLTTGVTETKQIPDEDLEKYIGGRGLGMKMLWDRLSEPGIDPLSSENPLIIMTSPFIGLPVPAASLTCFITKSPHTSPFESDYPYASTVNYSLMGGFIGPEIRFAGYDGIVITGKASSPVYIVINNDKVAIRDANKFWGMKTDAFDKAFTEELGDRKQRFKTCYIGPAGEKLVEYASIMNVTGRASGRGGTGAVMGSKNLKAIAVRGTKMPEISQHKRFLELLEESRKCFTTTAKLLWEPFGSALSIEPASIAGIQTVKNFQEGTFPEIMNIGAIASKTQIWVRDFSCYCCPLACKKSGVVKNGPYAGISHDGPEYETGVMLGSNLLISNLEGLIKEIYNTDDYGMDILSTGNVIGFLMEAYEKSYIDQNFLDGIDLKWGNVDAALQMIDKIGKREGIGELCAGGVKALSEEIGQDSHKFAIHVKGQEITGWNIQGFPEMAICYATSNRGACHLNPMTAFEQNRKTIYDTLCFCSRAYDAYTDNLFYDILSSITGIERTHDEVIEIGERVFNLEKMFNYREGFRRVDDELPDRFFEDAFTIGIKKGAVLNRDKFKTSMDDYYSDREWDLETSKPSDAKLESLGLDFTMEY